MSDGKFYNNAVRIGKLVEEKNKAYGNSFHNAGEILNILYKDGIAPEQMKDALAITRILDKLFRIATAKDAFGENPWQDVAGYAILMSTDLSEDLSEPIPSADESEDEDEDKNSRTSVLMSDSITEQLPLNTNGAINLLVEDFIYNTDEYMQELSFADHVFVFRNLDEIKKEFYERFENANKREDKERVLAGFAKFQASFQFKDILKGLDQGSSIGWEKIGYIMSKPLSSEMLEGHASCFSFEKTAEK